MNREVEKLRELLAGYARAENGGAADGEHLRDEDFTRLFEIESAAARNSPAGSGDTSDAVGNFDEFATLRQHLAECDSCVERFRNFYAFFAPVETSEATAGKSEIAAAWQMFAPRIAQKKSRKLLTWLFPDERKFNFSAALGWSFAALLLVLTAIGFYTARLAEFENSRLAALLESQRQSAEERLKTLEQAGAQNSASVESEKQRLEEEKNGLQKQIARLQTEIERAKQVPPQAFGDMSPPPQDRNDAPTNKIDESLVVVNTPIYDVFPADAAVRGGEQSGNKLVIPNQAKNVVLILNAAGRAEFSDYQIELINNAGKTIRRGGGLRKDASGNFTLTLSKTILKTGNYRLRLTSKNSAGAPQTVAEYPFIVTGK